MTVQAMWVMLGVLAALAVAYRYYSAFLARRVAALDPARETPAHTHYDGQNFHPTNRWVLFGHHFAAISGAGPLIGPVLAIQFGYLPGLIWLVVGVCLAGAVQEVEHRIAVLAGLVAVGDIDQEGQIALETGGIDAVLSQLARACRRGGGGQADEQHAEKRAHVRDLVLRQRSSAVCSPSGHLHRPAQPGTMRAYSYIDYYEISSRG